MSQTKYQCPVCRCFGSGKLGGYCKVHYTRAGTDFVDPRRKDFFPTTGYHQGDFVTSGDFPVKKGTFGIEER